jgi:hypothetical protein
MHTGSRRFCFFACIGLRGSLFWLGKISKALWGNILSLFHLFSFGSYLGP